MGSQADGQCSWLWWRNGVSDNYPIPIGGDFQGISLLKKFKVADLFPVIGDNSIKCPFRLSDTISEFVSPKSFRRRTIGSSMI